MGSLAVQIAVGLGDQLGTHDLQTANAKRASTPCTSVPDPRGVTSTACAALTQCMVTLTFRPSGAGPAVGVGVHPVMFQVADRQREGDRPARGRPADQAGMRRVDPGFLALDAGDCRGAPVRGQERAKPPLRASQKLLFRRRAPNRGGARGRVPPPTPPRRRPRRLGRPGQRGPPRHRARRPLRLLPRRGPAVPVDVSL